MAIVRSIDRRQESRLDAEISVTVWGLDVRGERFLQEAHARNISLSGAMLSGLDAELRSGDVIGIFYAGKNARYRVIWVRYGDVHSKIQAAVHRVEPDECPWMEFLSEGAQEISKTGDSPQNSDSSH